MSQHRLLSLIVGINEFAYVSNLKGCENDANEMADFLLHQKSPSLKVEEPKILLNQAATKAAIVQAFEESLIHEAGVGDKVVFHFSGHGTQESAPPIFLPYEPDRMLEGLVCHDTGEYGASMLADKEIRYLISKLAEKGPDIICIFDCCHSGDMRDSLKPEMIARTAQTGRAGVNYTGRPWEDFIFSKDLALADPAVFEEEHLDNLIPQGRHVQLTACLANEKAYEHPHKKRGYFTDALLDILKQAHGPVSYLEIQRRISHYVKNRRVKQSPQVNTPRGYQGDMFRSFLLGDHLEPGIRGNVRYNGYKKEWTLDLGAIHGLTATDPEKDLPVVVETKESNNRNAFIQEVKLNESILVFPEGRHPIQEGEYKATLSGLMMDTLNVYLDGEEEGISVFQKRLEASKEELEVQGIYFVEDLNKATYKVLAQNQEYSISTPLDHRPLVREISGYTAESVDGVFGLLRHISKWLFIKNLQSSFPGVFGEAPIRLTIEREGYEPFQVQSGEAITHIIHVDPDSGETSPYTRFHFENVNVYGKSLYVACFYMDPLFGVEVDYLEPKVVKLEGRGAHTGIWALNSGGIRMRLPEYMIRHNWKEDLMYLKVIIADQPFNVDPFYLFKLGEPGRSMDREFMPDVNNWTTQLFEFRVGNPKYDPEKEK